MPFNPQDWRPSSRQNAIEMRARLIADSEFGALLAKGDHTANTIMRQIAAGMVGTEQNWQSGAMTEAELKTRGDGI